MTQTTQFQAFRGARTVAILIGLAIASPLIASCGPPIAAIEMALEDRTGEQIAADAELKAGLIADVNNRMTTKLAALLTFDVYEGNVMITGEVESRDDRIKVAEVVNSHPDSKTVYNELQVVDPDAESNLVDDVVIKQKFFGKLATTAGVTQSNWRYQSVNGTLYLFGRALSQAEMNKVVAIARDTEKVRRVVNHAFVRAK
ncbi:BON domain-containing protein [Aestuariispira insulae]|uniref:Osmotically-inducible protein OsmY n=1 Tax=Aestuariispira insulae TaxID=1461337 RepID=A0A3D9HPW8_9PROT|nr:BON domain-containing protein [Aestuariispira insulae]RED51522.1 osmotically-inducible protein OsmY [Aestuariispira insulae]